MIVIICKCLIFFAINIHNVHHMSLVVVKMINPRKFDSKFFCYSKSLNDSSLDREKDEENIANNQNKKEN